MDIMGFDPICQEGKCLVVDPFGNDNRTPTRLSHIFT